MPSLVAIVGNSDTGKTTLIEKLIPSLKQKGYTVGTVKHTHHGFKMDKPGKDTWRHQTAGADTVVAVSPQRIAIVKTSPLDSLEAALPYLEDRDIVLAEGFKGGNCPKIEIFRKAAGGQPVCLEDPRLVALVTDVEIETGLPLFDPDDVDLIADFIEKQFLK
ncbi:MAG: molybdopterin-guanine dinucleotide biosynthesis protein B [Desulfobacterales bacterium]|nr:molybdopterin-guanine dinucleotide biosynthesis protein B [Desulfobacterales bacterium]